MKLKEFLDSLEPLLGHVLLIMVSRAPTRLGEGGPSALMTHARFADAMWDDESPQDVWLRMENPYGDEPIATVFISADADLMIHKDAPGWSVTYNGVMTTISPLVELTKFMEQREA